MENEHYSLVDALPYIDTQLGQTEVAAHVKALIEEEMRHFEPRDYLASLPLPPLPVLNSEAIASELARVEAGGKMEAIDLDRYKLEPPEVPNNQDPAAWRTVTQSAQMQLEYNRLCMSNLELLERWGAKCWVAHSGIVRISEQALAGDAQTAKAAREEVNKRRKLDQVSCGNELRKLTMELERYTKDNSEVQTELQRLEAEVDRLKRVARERGIAIDLDGPGSENGIENGAENGAKRGASEQTNEDPVSKKAKDK